MIKVIKTKENKDGSLNVEVEYKKEFKEFLKETYKKKRFSKGLVKKFVLEALKWFVNFEKMEKNKKYSQEELNAITKQFEKAGVKSIKPPIRVINNKELK